MYNDTPGALPEDRPWGRWHRLPQGDRHLPEDHEWGHWWQLEGKTRLTDQIVHELEYIQVKVLLDQYETNGEEELKFKHFCVSITGLGISADQLQLPGDHEGAGGCWLEEGKGEECRPGDWHRHQVSLQPGGHRQERDGLEDGESQEVVTENHVLYVLGSKDGR